MKVLLLDFSQLDIIGKSRDAFISVVKNTIGDKFSGTGITFTDKPEIAEQLEDSVDLGVLFIHNNNSLDTSPNSLGKVHTLYDQMHNKVDIGEVNVKDIITQYSPESNLSLAKITGTVSSHEGGHMFLPSGHSIDSLNLMSEGPDLFNTVKETNGEGLQFTKFQKDILSGKASVTEELSLPEAEQLFSKDPSSLFTGDISSDLDQSQGNSLNDHLESGDDYDVSILDEFDISELF